MAYEGKTKVISPIGDGKVKITFKDSLTAFNGEKKETLQDKGKISKQISAALLTLVAKHGVSTHLIDKGGDDFILCQEVEIIPVEVVVRNIATGSFTKRYGIQERTFTKPLVELFVKDDKLGDPLISFEAAQAMGLVDSQTLARLQMDALITNQVLSQFFDTQGVTLVDFKLEFGRNADGQILLADDITPDSMRLWRKDAEGIDKILDKDRFRKDLGDVLQGYESVAALCDAAEGFQAVVELRIVLDVLLKHAIRDPRGETVHKALRRLGASFVSEARVGKNISLTINKGLDNADLKLFTDAIRSFLTNPLVETCQLRVVE